MNQDDTGPDPALSADVPTGRDSEDVTERFQGVPQASGEPAPLIVSKRAARSLTTARVTTMSDNEIADVAAKTAEVQSAAPTRDHDTFRIRISTRQLGDSVHRLGEKDFFVKLAFGDREMSQTAYGSPEKARRSNKVSVALPKEEGVYRTQVTTQTEPVQQFDLVIAVTAPLNVRVHDSFVGHAIVISPALSAVVTADRAFRANPK